MKTMIVETKPTVAEFVAALMRGREAVKTAADILCRMVDSNPKAYEAIVKDNPGISYNLLANLERVGRGVMHLELLFDNSPAARKLIALPASQQREIYEHGANVVNVVSGKRIVENKPPQNLSPVEANRVFDNGRVRTVEEQLKIIETVSPVPKSKRATRYTIEGDRVTILERTTFTATELEELLAKLIANSRAELARKK